MCRSDSLDLSALAAEAFAPTTSEERRNALLGELLPCLHQRAWKITRSEHHAADLVQEVCLVCLKGKFDPLKGAFLGWAHTIMSRRWSDENRPRRRAAGGENTLAERASAYSHYTCFEQNLDQTTPLSENDVTTIRHWSARERVILLCRDLLWRKVPAPLWEETLASLGLPAGFPGPDFAALSKPERNALLAEVLGIPVNTLCQCRKRGSERVRGLSCVRELAEV